MFGGPLAFFAKGEYAASSVRESYFLRNFPCHAFGVTPLMDENDYCLVYLVRLVHFVRFVCLPLLLDFSPWRLHANLPYAAPSGRLKPPLPNQDQLDETDENRRYGRDKREAIS